MLRRVLVRRALGSTLLIAPFAALVVFSPGCGDTELPQDVCSWLNDANNCYARFADDVETRCGREFNAAAEPLDDANGYFAARDELEICILNEGGQVIFDPPLDTATFPLSEISFTILDERAEQCGLGAWTDERNFSIGIETKTLADLLDEGGTGGATPNDPITGGTFTILNEPGRDQLEVECPGGFETFVFNSLVLERCDSGTPPLPVAYLESSPGAPPGGNSSGVNGYVRFRVEYPPADVGGVVGTEPRVVEYFNCSIPPPPAPCLDGTQNGTETDIDCGGTCTTKCAEGQGCNENADCTSNNCGLNGGFRQCLP